MRLVLPRLYVILDAALATRPVGGLAEQLYDAGVRLFQYRDKKAPAGEQLRAAEELTGRLIPRGASLIVNDRPDVAVLAGASGVHLGKKICRWKTGERSLGQ